MLRSSADSRHFIDNLEERGVSTALICEDRTRLSYSALAEQADAFGQLMTLRTGQERGLLLIEMCNTKEAVIAYIGAVRARWPVILVAEGAMVSAPDLLAKFKPDLVYHRSGDDWRLEAGTQTGLRDMHPELAVMLSTSGSTGSTKLVRLSRSNIHENARSIVEYLEIGTTRVAITNLPCHYSYGLSVINSFLLAGGAVVLTEASVMDGGFHALLNREGVTDLAGVPYTYDLLERLGFRTNPPATLRVMTQAGGRLPPDMVRLYADFARDHVIRFFVMYGQTEATARMAYLPPNQSFENPACIGIPIPRGSFSLRAEDGAEITKADQSGELIYRGPNIMMGYAQEAADLSIGPALDELATGDIATRQVNGLYRIVGRTSRFSKIAGLRIGFDDVEAMLRTAGLPAHVTGNDNILIIALRSGEPEAACQYVSKACGLPLVSIFAWHPQDMAMLSSGKPNYQEIRRTGLALAAAAQSTWAAKSKRSIAHLYAKELNQSNPNRESSFIALGGDSLAYVAVSVKLEDILGALPSGWEAMPIKDLQAMADAEPMGRQTPARLTIGTDVLLRLLAISLIFIGHGAPTQTEGLRGGSSILFCLAGYSMALIQLPQLLEGRVVPIVKGIMLRLVLPYFILMTVLLVASDAHKSVSWYLLISVFEMTAEQRGPLFSFWFIETLIHSIVLTCALFLIPSFRSVMRDSPFQTMLVLIILATGFRWAGANFWPNGNAINLTLDGWLYAFLIGWAVHFARTGWQKVVILLLAASLAFDQFGFWTGRAYWLTFAVALLLVVPSLTINRKLGHLLVYAAGATYFMYLSHAIVVHLVRFQLGTVLDPVMTIILVYSGSVSLGILGAEAWRRILNVVHQIVSRYRETSV